MLSVQPVGTADTTFWDEVASSSERSDIYLLPEYVIPASSCEQGELMLASYRAGSAGVVLYPFVLRKVLEGAAGRKPAYDIVSPYGYTGPLIDCSAEIYAEFRRDFVGWCRRHNVISEFIRCNPFTGNNQPIVEPTVVESRSSIVVVDLTRERDALWRALASTHRRNIKAAERENIEFADLDPEAWMSAFCELYWSTMDRVHARSSYFFPRSYFYDLAASLGRRLRLFAALHQGEPAAMALCLTFKDRLHYHLGCSRADLLRFRPNNLLFWQIIQKTKEEGFSLFNLGGGLRPGDSLHKFKAGYSSEEHPFYCAYTIFDSTRYRLLSEWRRRWLHAPKDQFYSSSYFPLYRIEQWGEPSAARLVESMQWNRSPVPQPPAVDSPLPLDERVGALWPSGEKAI